MRVVEQRLPGQALLLLEPREDERGSLTRCFCRDELESLGRDLTVAQANLSHSRKRGTLRGLHYQTGPGAETKLVLCLAGSVFDVALDLRPNSGSFGDHAAALLTAGNGHAMLVPPGCAHGFLTLEDDTLLLYMTSRPHDPARERGVRWDDPTFALPWPFAPSLLSDRDRRLPDFDAIRHLAA